VKSFAKYMMGFSGALLTLAMLSPMANATITYTYTGGTPAGEAAVPDFEDASFTKLLDGSTGTGTNNVFDESWVAWQNGGFGGGGSITDQITFNFGASVTITKVAFDFMRNDNSNAQLPLSVTIDGTDFPTTDFAADGTGFVSYAGSFTGSTMVVNLNHPTSNWIFVNEVQFTTNSTAPEPASLLLVGLGIGGVVLGRRRRKLVSPR
jgi:hypothetical protein